MVYYNPTLNKNNMQERMYKLDKDIYIYLKENDMKIDKVEIVIAGSTALALNNIDVKKTEDIDIIKISHNIPEGLLERYNMNTRVSALENFFPYNYIDRIEKLNLCTNAIEYYIVSLEDIVIAKIQANRGKDLEQLKTKELINRIDWDKLKQSALEMKDSLFNDEQYKWFIVRYNDFVEVNGHEEVIIENV